MESGVLGGSRPCSVEDRIGYVSIVVALYAASAVSAVTISQSGQAKVIIVIAVDAPEPEPHAAKELAAFLGQATGATFELAAQKKAGASCIFVGSAAAKQADTQFSTEGLGAEGLVIKTVGDDLILAGGIRAGRCTPSTPSSKTSWAAAGGPPPRARFRRSPRSA